MLRALFSYSARAPGRSSFFRLVAPSLCLPTGQRLLSCVRPVRVRRAPAGSTPANHGAWLRRGSRPTWSRVELEELRGGADGERVETLGPDTGPPPPPTPARAARTGHWRRTLDHICRVCVVRRQSVLARGPLLWVFLHGLPCALSLVRKVGAGRWAGELIADAWGTGDGRRLRSPPAEQRTSLTRELRQGPRLP